ncbi:unnamed protein product, partial [Symbiodinium sp. KB8]
DLISQQPALVEVDSDSRLAGIDEEDVSSYKPATLGETLGEISLGIGASRATASRATGTASRSKPVLPLPKISESLSVRLQKRDVLGLDTSVLRGISLRRSLRGAGWMWWRHPLEREDKVLSALWNKSKLVDRIDMCLSHTWKTDGRVKVASLLFRNGAPHIFVWWWLGALLAVILYLSDALPMPGALSAGSPFVELDCPLGPWTVLFTMITTFLAFLVSPYIPGLCAQPDTCFMDAACINYASEAMRERAAYGVGGILSVSKEFCVLWSAPYFQRLWCVFELATYSKASSGKVRLEPFFHELATLGFMVCLYLGAWVFWMSIAFSDAPIAAYLPFLALLPCMLVLHLLRRRCVEIQDAVGKLKTFEFDSLECEREEEREFAQLAVERWFGSASDFTEHVRVSLHRTMEKQLQLLKVPTRYLVVAIAGPLAMSLDIWLGLYKASASSDLLMRYLAGQLIGCDLLWTLASLQLAVLLAKRFAQPCWPGPDILQTLALGAFCSGFFVLGAYIAFQVSSGSVAASVAWAVFAFGMVQLLDCLPFNRSKTGGEE